MHKSLIVRSGFQVGILGQYDTITDQQRGTTFRQSWNLQRQKLTDRTQAHLGMIAEMITSFFQFYQFYAEMIIEIC